MAKLHVDTHALRNLLASSFTQVSTLRPLAEGEDSRAFAFDADEGPLVVRVNRSSAGFEMDRLAHRQFNSSGLPIPEVLLTTQAGSEGWFCVSRRLPGETLQALPAGDAFAYGAQLGRLLDTIASATVVNVAGSGPISVRGAARHDRWPDFVSAVTDWDWPFLSADDASAVKPMVEQVSSMSRNLPDVRGLVHGDFGSNNVLVADGVITGLVDWSEMMIGDPLYDLANILFWRPWLDCMEQQCRYFDIHESWRLAEVERLQCYQLRIGLDVLLAAMMERDTRVAAWALTRCRTIGHQH